jgi:hypothetical protein
MFKISRKINFTQNFKKFTSSTFSTLETTNPNSAAINFEILHTNLQKEKITIENTHEKTLKDLEQLIKKGNKFTTVEFKTWDDSIISKNNNLNMLFERNEPIFTKINSMEWQLLNLGEFNYTTLENIKIKEDLTNTASEEFSQIAKIIKKYSLSPNSNKSILTEEEINKIAWQFFKIKNFYQSKDHKTFLSQFKNLGEILEKFYELKSEYNYLHQIKEKLLEKCQFKAKILILLAGILFIIELFLIYYGTFIKYSWDIVEPMTYLAGCTNIILVLFYKKKMGTSSPLHYYTQRFFNNLVRKKKFDQLHFEEVGRKLREIEKVLNK